MFIAYNGIVRNVIINAEEVLPVILITKILCPLEGCNETHFFMRHIMDYNCIISSYCYGEIEVKQ